MVEIIKKLSQKLGKLWLVELKDKELDYPIRLGDFNKQMVFIL